MSQSDQPLESPRPWEPNLPKPNSQPEYQPAYLPTQTGNQPYQPTYQPYIAYPTAKVPTHPVVETDYTNFWRSPSWKVSKPITGLVLFFVFWLLASFVTVGAYIFLTIFVGIASGQMDSVSINPEDIKISMTPGLLLATNVSLAAMIPISMLIAKWIFGQKVGFVSSVVGKIRWQWLFVCLGILLPLWIILQFGTWLLNPDAFSGFSPNKDTVAFLAVIILTTPLQCAGEEYGFRGAVNRCVASFVRPDKKIAGSLPIGVVLGAVVSSLCFMLAHGSTDIWLNIFYFFFGFVSVILAYKTGGLEASIAMHIVNNLTEMVITLPFGQADQLLQRGAGTADASVLVQMGVIIIGMTLVLLVAKRRGIRATNAPGADPTIQVSQA